MNELTISKHPATAPRATPPPAPAGYHELPRNRMLMTIIGLMLTLLLAALDQTIVGTAMPRIIAELQGFDHYAWVTTAYLLTQHRRRADRRQALRPVRPQAVPDRRHARSSCWRRRSAALSQDMTQLIVFRGLQGIGGGMLMSMVFTTISSIFPPAKRGRIQGVFTSVFGFASIVGPLLGGYLTDALSWRWVFYVNLPLGLIALAVLWFGFPNIRPAAHQTARSTARARSRWCWRWCRCCWRSPGAAASTPGRRRRSSACSRSRRSMIGVLPLDRVARAPSRSSRSSLFKNRIVAISTLAMLLRDDGHVRDDPVRSAVHPGRDRDQRHRRAAP